MNILYIYYNEFYPEVKTQYKKVKVDDFGDLVEEYEYKRKPRAAIFDEVYENGSGGRLSHRDKRVFGHFLEKKS